VFLVMPQMCFSQKNLTSIITLTPFSFYLYIQNLQKRNQFRKYYCINKPTLYLWIVDTEPDVITVV